MKKHLEYIDWKFVLTWVIAITAYYLFLALPKSASFLLANDTMTRLIPDLDIMTNARLSIVLRYTFIGALLGFVQWLVLRKYLERAGWWIATLAFNGLLNGLLMVLLFYPAINSPSEIEFSRFFYTYATILISIILLTGVLQWLVLYRQAYKRGVWIIAALVAHGLDEILGYVALLIVPYSLWVSTPLCSFRWLQPLAFPIEQGLIGIMTGAVMSWMLNHPFDDPELAIEEEG